MEQIQIRYFKNSKGETVKPLEQISKGNAIDLRCNEDIWLDKGAFMLIPLGVGMKLPEGYHAEIYPRSSTFKKWGILQVNSVGIVDDSFAGDEDQWMMPVYATRQIFIEKDSRVCQFQIVKNMPEIEFMEVEHLEDKSRGGFGSTGVK